MRISVPSDVESEVLVEGEEEHLPADYVRDQLYMILREGVRNAVAHSEADSIAVEVKISPREVVSLVWDHGLGFETSEPKAWGSSRCGRGPSCWTAPSRSPPSPIAERS